MLTPRLTDGLVELRPPRVDDVDEFYDAARESIADVTPWMGWLHPAYERIETAEWVRSALRAWDEDLEYPFVYREVATGRVLGSCEINSLDRENRWANLGYWLRTSATGRGFATAAARLAASFGFAELGLDRVEILAATGNVSSRAVADRLGAVREGVLRRRLRVHDVSHDAVVYSLVREDWR
ncbi:MAG: GNAT family N-acetyltransferase [Actinobacteria bacterium]|nr:GNAT family N-acetyltransferase [Actinomycetota bacterium]